MDLQEKLHMLGFKIEKARVIIEQTFYPRDIDLRVIDIEIHSENSASEELKGNKKAVIRDFFAAFDRCLEYDNIIKEEAKKEAAKEEMKESVIDGDFVFLG